MTATKAHWCFRAAVCLLSRQLVLSDGTNVNKTLYSFHQMGHAINMSHPSVRLDIAV